MIWDFHGGDYEEWYFFLYSCVYQSAILWTQSCGISLPFYISFVCLCLNLAPKSPVHLKILATLSSHVLHYNEHDAGYSDLQFRLAGLSMWIFEGLNKLSGISALILRNRKDTIMLFRIWGIFYFLVSVLVSSWSHTDTDIRRTRFLSQYSWQQWFFTWIFMEENISVIEHIFRLY
jgi:hypothetical protein